jgi:predicted MFS family arabinose efflux permease
VGTTSAGLLLASLPFGGAVGAVLVTRHVRARARRPVSRAMAVATGLPLVLSALRLPLPAVLVAWAVSGALSSYLLEVMNEVVQAVPAIGRARVVGRVGAGLVTAQGIGLAVFGVLAQAGGVRAAVAWAGGVGVLIATALAFVERPPRRSKGARQEDGAGAGSTRRRGPSAG